MTATRKITTPRPSPLRPNRVLRIRQTLRHLPPKLLQERWMNADSGCCCCCYCYSSCCCYFSLLIVHTHYMLQQRRRRRWRKVSLSVLDYQHASSFFLPCTSISLFHSFFSLLHHGWYALALTLRRGLFPHWKFDCLLCNLTKLAMDFHVHRQASTYIYVVLHRQRRLRVDISQRLPEKRRSSLP